MSLRYVTWRNGRPRFNPSARERALGFRPHDLKSRDGKWLSYSEAGAYGEAIYAEIIAARKTRAGIRNPQPPRNGYVYFLFAGDEVKIGYSAGPLTRQKQLSTAMAREPQALIAVRGGRGHEIALHRLLAAHRVRSEWFKRCPELLDAAMRMMTDPSSVIVANRRDPT